VDPKPLDRTARHSTRHGWTEDLGVTEWAWWTIGPIRIGLWHHMMNE
jgi:hypothetical protein